MRWIAASLAALALISWTSRTTAAPDVVVRTGPHYRVLCHFDDAACADAALDTAESVWPVVSDLLGLAPGPLDRPMDIHLYRRAADYLAAERSVTGGKFAQSLGFSSYETRSAYVPVQPDLTDEALAVLGLTTHTRHNVAHEATHLACWRASPSFRSHPVWFSEGMAVWAEEETVAARGWSAHGEGDPLACEKMMRARRLFDGGALPTATQVLRDQTKDMDVQDRYAVQALLFRRLVSRRDAPAFRAAVRTALALDEGPGFAGRFLDAITAPYRDEGLAGLDLDFEQYVRSQSPAWDQVSRALSMSGDTWTQAAFTDLDSVAWHTSPAGSDSYEVRGEFEMLPGTGKAQQMNVLLARDTEFGFVSVAFVARYGVVLLRYDTKLARWDRLAEAPSKDVQVGRRVAFRVAVDGPRVTVHVDGTVIASGETKGLAMSGPWGVGALAGSVGIWRGVRL